MGSSGKKRSNTSFLLQGSILAIASIVSRIIGLVYRVPLTAIIGKTGNDYYGTAYEIYNIILLISCYSIPLAVSKMVAARMAKKQARDAYQVLKGALLFAFVSGTTAMLIVFFGADFFTGTVLKTPLSSMALKILAPTILLVAIVGVFRGFFQGLNTMMPSAVSQIVEQLIHAVVSVTAAYFLFPMEPKSAQCWEMQTITLRLRSCGRNAGDTFGRTGGAFAGAFCVYDLSQAISSTGKARPA